MQRYRRMLQDMEKELTNELKSGTRSINYKHGLERVIDSLRGTIARTGAALDDADESGWAE